MTNRSDDILAKEPLWFRTMPLRATLPNEAMYAFVLLCIGHDAQILFYSGEWTQVDFASHVYRLLRSGGWSRLQGATGECKVWRGNWHGLMQTLGGVSCTCSVCQRMTSTMANTMSLCGGCRFVRYCSEQCRRIGWASGHREECAHIQRAFPRMHSRRYTYTAYGHISGYEYELWLHLIRQYVNSMTLNQD